MHKIFVYGTLKVGEPNHQVLTNDNLGRAEFVREGQTVEKYPLVIATALNIPFLLDCPGKGHHVHGEIYNIDAAMLTFLDQFERHPTTYYRDQRQIQARDGTIHECGVYVLKDFRPHLLEQEFFESYTDNKPGLKYLEVVKRRDGQYTEEIDKIKGNF